MSGFEITKTVKYTAMDSNTIIIRTWSNAKDHISVCFNNKGVREIKISTAYINTIMNTLKSVNLPGRDSDIVINIVESNYTIVARRRFTVKLDDDIEFRFNFNDNCFTTIGGKIIKNILSAF